jgi:hypothetical protein
MWLRANLMKLNLECRYLAALLLDKFALKNDIVARDADLYSAATLLVAAKMREVDTKTPFVSEVKRFDSKIFFLTIKATIWSFKDLKEKEIVISDFFDWNLCFYTYFDYLEHFTNIGILYSTDLVEPSNTKSKNVFGSSRSILGSINCFTTPEDRLARPRNLSLVQDQLETMNHASSHKKYSNTDLWETDHTTNKTSEEIDANSLCNGGQMSEFDLSAKKNIFCSSEKKAPRSYVSPDREGVMVSRFDQRTQRSLALKMEDRVFELAKRILDDLPVPTFRQIHMAFAIVKFVRNEFGLTNRISEEDYLFENIFQIEKLDYTVELSLVREKYGVRYQA